MKQADLDKLVLRYLKKRRLMKAESMFREEAKLPDNESIDVTADLSIFDELLFFSVANGDPSRYVQEYDCLAAWVDASLDLYKGELSQILWPIFVQCYTSLVTRGAASEAQQVMNLGGARFKDPVLGGRHTQDLERLQASGVPHLMGGATGGGILAAQQAHVTLSRFSLNLLLTFLHATRLTLMLSIINQHTALQVTESPPGELLAEGTQAEAQAFASSQQQVAAFNATTTLELGILQGGSEDIWHKLRAASLDEAAGEEVPTLDQDGKPLAKKARASLQRSAQLAKAAQADEALPRVISRLPLPESDAGEASSTLQADLEARVEVSATALPSCAFFTLVNTAQSLNCAAFTTDSTQLIGGFADSTVRLYDLQRLGRPPGKGAALDCSSQGAACRVLHGHSGAVYGVDASPDGQVIYSGSADGTVRAWGFEAGAALAAFKGHMFPVWHVAACPAGVYVASASADSTARLWSTERSSALRMFVGHTADVDVVEWHPTCNYIATGSSDRSVRMWDAVSGAPIRIFLGLRSPVTALSFSPDGTKIVIGCHDGEVSVWDTASAQRMAACRLHSGAVWTVSVSRGEGSVLASGGADGTLRLWNLADSQSQPRPSAGAPLRSLPMGGCMGLLQKYRTKATPILRLHWSHRNLLLGTGAFTLPSLR